MCRRAIFSLLLFVAMACAVPSQSSAQEPYPRGEYGGQVMPLDRILPNVRAGRPGRFYDAEGPFPDAYGGYHYRIKWLTPEGRVVWLDADARSGRVLGQAKGDWREQGPPPAYGQGYAPRTGPGYAPRTGPGYAPRTGPGYMGRPQGGFRGGPPPGGGFGRPGGGFGRPGGGFGPPGGGFGRPGGGFGRPGGPGPGHGGGRGHGGR